MLNRFMFALALVTWLAPFATAQETKSVYRIGYLLPRALEPRDHVFRDALRDLGYVEGKNLTFEYRLGTRKQLPELARELAALGVDIIVAPGSPPAKAAKAATNTIPIVFATVADPVGSELVASLAHPGGNVTGVTPSSAELSAKRLELLKEIIPDASRIAVLSTPEFLPLVKKEMLREMEATARSLGVQLLVVEVRGRDDFERVFAAIEDEGVQALTVLPVPMFRVEQQQIVDLAARNGLPTVFHWKPYVYAGGLMSYGPDGIALYRRAAAYVDKILKGAKPADLPVERASHFELVINVKAAKELGVTIPPSVLYRADEIIK